MMSMLKMFLQVICYTYQCGAKILVGKCGAKVCRRVGGDNGEHPWDGPADTTESPDQQGFLLFLDTLTSQELDGTLTTTVYRKPRHTGQYLHWDNHHSITKKYSIYSTLSHRVQFVCSN